VGRIESDFGVGGKWGLHLGASLKRFGDVDAAGIGKQANTGYDEWSYDVRFDAKLSDNWDLTVAHQLLQQDDAWRTHSTIYGVSFAGTEIGEDLRRVFDHDRTLSYARFSGHDLSGFIDKAALHLLLPERRGTAGPRAQQPQARAFRLRDRHLWRGPSVRKPHSAGPPGLWRGLLTTTP